MTLCIRVELLVEVQDRNLTRNFPLNAEMLCKGVASEFGSLVSMDKLFSLDTDLTKVIELVSLHGTYIVLRMALVDSEQIKRSVRNSMNVLHTI
jgi:hypothetical protein